LWYFIIQIIDFIIEFWEILEFFFEKNRDIWNTKHFQNSIIYYLSFYFLVLLTSFFLVYLPIFVKKILKFLCFLLYRSEILSKNSTKQWFFFKKIWYIWNPKFHQNSLIYYFFLLFLAFLTSFFAISPIQTCQKIIEFFVVFYWRD